MSTHLDGLATNHATSSLSRRFIHYVALAIATSGVVAGSRFVSTIIVAHLLGNTALGLYAYYLAVVPLIEAVVALGGAQAMSAFTASDESRVDTYMEIAWYYSVCLLVGCALAAAVCGAFWGTFPALVTISAGAFLGLHLIPAVMRGAYQKERQCTADVAREVCLLLGLVIFCLALDREDAALWGTMAGAIVAWLILTSMVWHQLEFPPRRAAKWLRVNWRIALLPMLMPLWLISFFTILHDSMDRFLVQAYLGFDAVGELHVVRLLTIYVGMPLLSLSAVLVSTFPRVSAQSLSPYRRVLSISLMLFPAISLATLAVCPWLMPLISPNISSAAYLLVLILSPIIVVRSIGAINSSLCIASRSPYISAFAFIIGMSIGLPAMFFLGRTFGLPGYCAGMLVSYMANFTCSSALMWKTFPQETLLSCKLCCLSLALFVLCEGVAALFYGTPQSLLAVVLYVLAGILLGIWKAQDCTHLVTEVLRRRQRSIIS